MNITKLSRPGLRSIAAFGTALLIIAGLSACSMADGGAKEPLVSGDVADSESVIEALESAAVIEAKKKVISFGDSWTISADGVEIGEIRGEAIYLIGDTYSLFSKAGNLVGSEAEGYRIVNHRAGLYGYNNEPRGEIKQKLTLFLSEYEIKDEEGKLNGTAKQKIHFTLSFDILGRNGAAEYSISKAFLSIGANLKIEAKSKDRTVDAIDALWLAVIASEVEEAADESSDD